MSEPVTVKGNGNKLEFWMDAELPYAELREALINRLDVNASFYIGSKRPVVFYGKIFTDTQKRELKNLLSREYCFNRVSFVDDAEDDEPPKKSIEEKPPAPQPKQERQEVPEKNEGFVITPHEDKADNYEPIEHLFIAQTVRSGQRIQATGNITIVGDVNSGSEIIAGGSVAVFGRLSGMVHAGAFGDTGATIAANKLMASQIRLAGKIAVLPHKHKPAAPEIVRFIDGKIVISSIN